LAHTGQLPISGNDLVISTIKYVSFDNIVKLWMTIRQTGVPHNQESCVKLHIKHLHITNTLWLSHKLLLSAPSMLLASTTKPAAFELLHSGTCYQSTELINTSRHISKIQLLTLPRLCHYASLICLWSTAICTRVLIDWSLFKPAH